MRALTVRQFLLLPILATLALLSLASPAATPLDDAALAGVSGRDGIVMNAHLQLNTQPGSNNRVSLGFKVQGNTSYLLLDRVSGTLDLLGLEVKPATSSSQGDVIQVGMPSFLGFKDFGIRAIGVQGDALAPISNSLGQIQLSGSAQMQGQLLMWAK
nr:hypothetical protein [uncultured Roseateles sp.]